MESRQYFICPVKFVFFLYQSYALQFFQQFADYLIIFLLIRKQFGCLFFQFNIASYLNLNISGTEQESRAECRMIGFQETQVINPLLNRLQFTFQIDFRFLAGKVVITVTAFQIEADTFVIIIIIG